MNDEKYSRGKPSPKNSSSLNADSEVFRPRRPTDEEYRGRLSAVRSGMNMRELDALLAFSAYMEREGNVLYLTGHRNVFPPWASDSVRNGAGLATALIRHDGPIQLFGSYQTDRTVLASTVGDIVETLDLTGAITAALRSGVTKMPHPKIGIAGSDVMPVFIYRQLVETFPHVQWVIADDLLTSLRMVKSPFEQSVLRQAAAIADIGIAAAFAATRPGARERDVALAAQRACIEAGADHVVRTRLRAGNEVLAQGRWPMATARRLAAGDLVYMDLLGWVDNYVFDVARTWSVGDTDGVRTELIGRSIELLDRTVAALAVGLTGDEVVRRVGAYYTGTEWEPRYSQMGHGVGIECVENPWIMPGGSICLQAGMVFSLEPSFTIPGVGKGQQEDMVLLLDDGPQLLSRAPRVLT